MTNAPPPPDATEPPRPPEDIETHGWGREIREDKRRGPRRGLAAVGLRFLHVWYRDAYVYLKMWKTNIFPPLIEPFLFLFAMGVGVGHYVESVQGVDYLTFVAPGIVATTAVIRASFENTYGSYFRMHFQSTFDAIISTPVNAEELSLGEICWGATRSFVNVVAVVFALILLGRMPLLWTPAVLALALVGGINFGAMSLLVTSKVKQTEYFNFFLTLVIFPAEFVTGAFFPVERLPDFLEPVAWVIPLTSLIDIIRSIALGTLSSTSLVELAYVLISTAVLVEVALRSMRKRLIG